tara:strand:- start:302 stop:502 length:201 start_codon:yes stop_codon:yes gene_type:complete
MNKLVTITAKENLAISLLKEIRIISGINSRKSNGFTSINSLRSEFDYINILIDRFKDDFKLEGFRK